MTEEIKGAALIKGTSGYLQPIGEPKSRLVEQVVQKIKPEVEIAAGKDEPLIVKVISPFTCMINGSLRTFAIGQIEYDYLTARHLIDSKSPVQVITKAQADAVPEHQCPKCKTTYRG